MNLHKMCTDELISYRHFLVNGFSESKSTRRRVPAVTSRPARCLAGGPGRSRASLEGSKAESVALADRRRRLDDAIRALADVLDGQTPGGRVRPSGPVVAGGVKDRAGLDRPAVGALARVKPWDRVRPGSPPRAQGGVHESAPCRARR